MNTVGLRNIGPKSAAWLRQVGIRSQADLVAAGPVGAFLKVRRAGFRPSLNLLYALEGALLDCHWQQVPEPRRQQLVAEYEAAAGQSPAAQARPAGDPARARDDDGDCADADDGFLPAEPAHDDPAVAD